MGFASAGFYSNQIRGAKKKNSPFKTKINCPNFYVSIRAKNNFFQNFAKNTI